MPCSLALQAFSDQHLNVLRCCHIVAASKLFEHGFILICSNETHCCLHNDHLQKLLFESKRMYKYLFEECQVRKSITKYIIGTIGFYTKAQIDKYIKEIIKTSADEHQDFLLELIKNHPEYELKGGSKITSIVRNWHVFGHWELCVMHDDGTKIPFSYKRCYRPTETERALVLAAMRTTIDNQILEFKRHRFVPGDKCTLCDKIMNTTRDAVVDHVFKFRTLAGYFINSDNKMPKTKQNSSRKMCFGDDEKEFRDGWANYHKQNALLRIICASCNAGLR